jgi:hypothetical protein
LARLEREVRATWVDRLFTRMGTEKVPDSKTGVRFGQAWGREVIEPIHGRLVERAGEPKLIRGRRR